MKNLNSISPGLRDNVLNQNIGKYDQITERMIYPIGTSYDIYNNVGIKKESIIPNGLLDYINNSTNFKKSGEFEEDLNVPYLSNRDKISIDLGYNSSVLPQYSNLEDESYHDPKDKNWISMGINSIIGYVMGDSIGISSNSEGTEFVSTSLDSSTSLVGRLTEYALGQESKLGKIGLTSLGIALSNSVIQRTRINEKTNEFFEKAVGFYDAVDTLDFDKMGVSSLPSTISKFSGNMLPLYFYTEVKKSDIKDFTWLNDSDLVSNDNNSIENIEIFNLPAQSLLSKTQKLFQKGKIQTLVSKISSESINGDSSVSSDNPITKGRSLKSINGTDYCRSWTNTNQYNKISSLIRPFSNENTDILKSNLNRVRPNVDSTSSLSKYGVLQDDGFVKIAPYKDDKFGKTDIKKYMFSIENLAWKDSIDSLIEGTSQDGPNGGRIMWFPPYDINFNETTSVNWNSDVFIGRGEPVYTYSNTERNGTLSFKIIVDHPSIINYYKQSNDERGGDKISDDDYLRFFAGCDVVKLPDEVILAEPPIKKAIPTIESTPRTIKFKVYFPNNYSGINDGYENATKYLYKGHGLSIESIESMPHGYEMENGKWMGLSDINMAGDDHGYFYRTDSYQNITDEQKKDTYSYALNNTKLDQKDPNSFSFKEAYEFISNPNPGFDENEEYASKHARDTYINSYIDTNECEFTKILAKSEYDIAARTNVDMLEKSKLYNNAITAFTESVEKLHKDEFSNDILNANGWSANITLTNVNTNDGIPGSSFDAKLRALKLRLDQYDDKINKYKSKLNTYIEAYVDFYTSGSTTWNDLQSKYTLSNMAKVEYTTAKNNLTESSTIYVNTAPEYQTYNDFYQTLLDAKDITIMGSASKQGKESQNTILADNRSKIIKEWLSKHNKDAKYTTPSIYSDMPIAENKDTNSKSAKLDRFAYIIITTNAGSVNTEAEANKIGYTTETETTNNEETVTVKRLKKSFYNYYYDKNGTNLKNDESKFFEKIGTSKEQKIIFDKLSEKIKYFSPAFHSTTPEGFNSRLTFLHQCTRQGPTSDALNTSNGKRSANNMSFGRPPICVLRIGDFYHTKVAIDSLNIDFDPLVWDLNKEGIGVQPMIANVTLNFKFIGGSDLTGPIARLQNAITFNFFANAGVYDDRNDRITKHEYNSSTKKYEDTYDTLYTPGVYDKGISTIIDTSINKT